MKQVGIFSGSFNPIHAGHLMLANFMKEFTYLDEVWFVVSPQNPLKETDDLLNDNIRLEMTRLALEDFDGFWVSDVEFTMPRPSYTINTLDKLNTTHTDTEFSLIIGGDNWVDFRLWKEYERLINTYRILVYPRLGEDIYIDNALRERVQLVKAPVVEISSTFIRKSIKEGKNVRAFLPAKVYDFIMEGTVHNFV